MAIPIEKFQEQGGRLKTDDLDFEAFRRQPLPPHVLRCLSYMHDIEYQTVLYTRELLLLPAWKDPQFTAFLTLWNYEEYWPWTCARARCWRRTATRPSIPTS